MIRTMKLVSFSLLILFLADEAAAASRFRRTDNPRNPIVIVPGVAGSQLRAKLNKTHSEHFGCHQRSNWYDLWVDVRQMTYALHCLIDNAKLRYDPVTRRTHNTPGVEIQVPGFGDTRSIEWLDTLHVPGTEYMGFLVEFLVKEHNYVRGVSVRGAPYDFRRAPNENLEYFVALERLIENTYTMNYDRRVILMGHSMGNSYILYFLNHQPQSWKDKYIKSFVSIAGPYGGSVKILKVLATGDDLDVKILRSLVFRELERTMTSTIFLMPYDNHWNGKEILVYGPHRNYTVNDYKQFFADIDHPMGYFMRQDTENLMKRLQAPGVEVHCLHGSNVSTVSSMSYADSTFLTNASQTNATQESNTTKPMDPETYSAIAEYADPTQYRDVDYPPRKWYDHQPRMIYGDGDGTVNIRSLHVCRKWMGSQGQPVNCRQFPGEDHLSIMNSKGLKSYLSTILS